MPRPDCAYAHSKTVLNFREQTNNAWVLPRIVTYRHGPIELAGEEQSLAAMTKPSLPSDARGASRLAIDLTLLVTQVVETMHHNIARRPGPLGRATFEPTDGLTGFVYRRVRGVTRLVGGAIDATLAPLVPLARGASNWPARDAVVAALNGILGDYLEETRNPLAIPMQLRLGGEPLALESAGIASALPDVRSRVVVMVHGLCMNDRQWNRQDHDHGQALARDLDASVLYLHYNTGRHISTNGAEFATLLERLVLQWPVPLCELVLIGHSMGGLVIRSACGAEGTGRASTWMPSLRALVFLGSPHHGAPLERGGHGVDRLLAASPYTAAFAELGRIRSAGITDLRHGSVRDEDWRGRDAFAHGADTREPLPLPQGIACHVIAGSLSKAAPPRGHPHGDGLVPVASALGRHADSRKALHFALHRTSIAYGTDHLDLLSSAQVYGQIQRWLAASPTAPRAAPPAR
jgi:hypothetical protein